MKKSFLIYLVALLLVTGVFGYLVYSRDKTKTEKNANVSEKSWETYINEEFGYLIQYPSSLAIREFPDSKTGAAFRPVDSANKLENEVISISATSRANNEELQNISFEEYTRLACGYEVQNDVDLNSHEEFKTNAGLIGYLVKCNASRNNESYVSDYTARFENNIIYTYPESGISAKFDIVDVYLRDSEYEDLFREMIKTFKLI